MTTQKKTRSSPDLPTTGTTHSVRPPAPEVSVDAPDDAPDVACDAPDGAHAVERLAVTYGATDAEVDALLGDVPADVVDEAASHCSTGRVCDEVAHVADGARAFFAGKGSPEDVRIGEVVVRAMVTCAAGASAAHRGDACARAGRKTAEPSATQAQGRALKLARGAVRQLANVLRGACAGDAAALARVRSAEQPAGAGHADAGPGRALLSLIEIGRELVADPARAPKAEAWGLRASWLDELDAVASAARRATAERAAPAPAAVDTAAQRRWRGMAVILLRRVVGAFAAGHAVSPSVPAVRPRFLRSLLSSKRPKKKAAAKPADAKPAAPAATKPAAPAPAADAKPAAPTA